ncbi:MULTISPECIES: efflux RND transporter permease subunit [Fusobacterium]|uniref:efflux RND transporter permease subunit n=1 Tax=Fusobacterium TaxID=848 RepID=UPI0014776D31|nr:MULTISPECIES: efflux RND transporter permease subunit [Fusobacterium]NME36716.1 efflux RND transporter permease subunit [Fusobacterium sp. FSA-380-WT-3A]
MTLAGLSIRRPVTTTMLMISMIFIGLIAMFSMKSELLPNMDIPVVTIRTTWTGAVPEDVETQVTKKIEEVLPNIEGIDKITSTSAFGESTIVVEFNYGIDADDKVTDIQREISRITNDLPADADTPIARKIEVGAGNLTMIAMFTGKSRTEMGSFVEEYLKPRLERISGIGEVNVYGNPEKQIQLQVNPDKLAAYNLSPMELYNIISYSNQNIPLGTIETGNKQIVARFMGETNYIDEIENLIINSNGNTLRVSDVADVVLTTEDYTNLGFLNQKEGIVVAIEKSADGSTIELNKGAYEALESLKPIMPPGTDYTILLDTSEDIGKSISGISGSAFQALILATIILLVFLKNIRATFLITLALPVAIIFTFAFLSFSGTSINLISLMGLSLGVGMLTDNSVVVIDNIYRHMTELNSPVAEASDNGTTEVTMSIIASSLTTMVVFIPILFIPGIAREIFRDMSLSIIFSNLAALIVSLTLMPMVASKFLSNKINITSEGKIFAKVKSNYLTLITWAVGHRWKVVFITLATFFVTVFVTKGFLKVEFMPKQDQGRYSIVAELGNGLDIQKSERIANQIEEIVKKDNSTQYYFDFITSNTIAINVDIGKKDTREESVFDVINRIRPQVEKIPDARISLSESFAMRAPERDVQINIMGPNYDELKTIGKQVADKIKNFNGAVDITSSLDPGNPEARIVLNRDKIKAYGINPTTVGQTISYFVLGGNRGDTATVKTGVEEIDILVRLPKEKRSSLNDLANLNVKIGDNKFVKVSDVADIITVEGSSEINKQDRIYSVSVSANDGGVGLAALQSELVKAFNESNPPSTVSYKFGGDSENLQDASKQLGAALGISIFLIYALLASQFENFVLPIIILGSFPLAFIGILIGLVLFRQPIDVMVMVGIIMLAGIVVNNAIVLIDFIKLTRERGSDRRTAIIESCRTRLRPILMTTMTTVFGMLPLALGVGEGSEIYRGMAVTVMFGLSFSTLLTLVVIPILYTLVEDMNIYILAFINKIITPIRNKMTEKAQSYESKRKNK